VKSRNRIPAPNDSVHAESAWTYVVLLECFIGWLLATLFALGSGTALGGLVYETPRPNHHIRVLDDGAFARSVLTTPWKPNVAGESLQATSNTPSSSTCRGFGTRITSVLTIGLGGGVSSVLSPIIIRSADRNGGD